METELTLVNVSVELEDVLLVLSDDNHDEDSETGDEDEEDGDRYGSGLSLRISLERRMRSPSSHSTALRSSESNTARRSAGEWDPVRVERTEGEWEQQFERESDVDGDDSGGNRDPRMLCTTS